jgi:hypothetical protein
MWGWGINVCNILLGNRKKDLRVYEKIILKLFLGKGKSAE